MFDREINHSKIIVEALSQFYFDNKTNTLEEIIKKYEEQKPDPFLKIDKLLNALNNNSAPKYLMQLLSAQIFYIKAAIDKKVETPEQLRFLEIMNKNVFERLDSNDVYEEVKKNKP